MRVHQISALERLKSQVWVAEIERIGSAIQQKKLSLMQIPNVFVFDELDGKTFGTIRDGKSMPSQQTVDKIAAGRELRNPNSYPFRQTRALIETGPDDFPLWQILAGDTDVCMQVVDGEVANLTGTAPDENSSFEQRVRTLFAHRLPANINADALWDLIAKERTKEMHYDFNVIALTATEGDEIAGFPDHVAVSGSAWVRADSVITLSAGQVVSTIALYVLSRQKKELIAPCHYMLVGVLQKAIEEQLSYGALVADFLSRDEWVYQGLS